MDVRPIAVVGAGQMGSGIAHVAAVTGHRVLLADVSDALVAKGRATIEKNLDREVARGKRSAEEKSRALERITLTKDLERLAEADLVIEAVVEDQDVKKEFFRPP